MTGKAVALRESIRASAGSGKTYALTGRYLQLIVRGVEPRRILAATFTRKAAGEIIGRVLERLSEVVLDPQKLPELSRQIGEPDLTQQHVVEALERVVRNLHTLRIGTLDSHFAQVAGAFALELKLTPGWRMADSWAEKQLVDEALEAALAEHGGAAAAQLLRLLAKDDAPRSIADEVAELVGGLHDRYLELGDAAWVALPDLRRLTDDAFQQALGEAMHAELPPGKMESARNKALPMFADEQFDAALKLTLVERALDGTPFDRRPLPPGLAEPLCRLAQHARAVCVDRLRQHAAALQTLLADFDRHLKRILAERALLRFADVTRAVAEGADEADDATTALRLGDSIDHLLLDEFQDTSLPQWRALSSVVDRIVRLGPGGSLVCVGDVKQAIYGFRGGEAAIAEALPETIPEMASRSLATSFRSSQVVIDAVNQCFGTVTQCPSLKDFRPAAAHWARGFDRHATARNVPGHVTLSTAPKAEKGEKQAQITSKYAAEEIARLADASPGRSWGVLVLTNQAVSRLVYDLRQKGVEASEEGQSSLTDSPAVAAVLAALRLADHPDDRIARFHVSHTPLGERLGLATHDNATQAIGAARLVRRQLLERGYGAAVAELCRALESVGSRSDRRRLGQLVEMAYAYEPRATLRPGDFVRLVESNKLDDATVQAPVRVMTIHQAKGLEFDGVVLPQLDRNWRPFTPKVVWRRREPTGRITEICPYASKALRECLPQSVRDLHDEHEARDVRESLCKLYVAMTRPRYALHMMIAPVSDPKKTAAQMSGLLRYALAPAAPALPRTTLYEHGDPTWAQQAPSGDLARPFVASEEPIHLAPRTRRRRHQPRVQPSAEGGSIDLGRDLLGGSAARREGVLAHAALEALAWLPAGPEGAQCAQSAARAALTEIGATAEEMRQTLTRLERWLAQRAIGELFDEATYRSRAAEAVQVELWRERAFAMRLADGIVEGRIDRLVAVRSGGRIARAEVIDFKTDRLRETGDVQALAERHRPQIESYRAAAARWFALAAEQVVARVVYLDSGQVVAL